MSVNIWWLKSGSQQKPALCTDCSKLQSREALLLNFWQSSRILSSFSIPIHMFGAGVIPHTQWNVAATGIQGQLLASRATLLTDYVDSEVTSFDLKSFYYRCILK